MAITITVTVDEETKRLLNELRTIEPYTDISVSKIMRNALRHYCSFILEHQSKTENDTENLQEVIPIANSEVS
jgi:hypothetical protein